MQRLFAILLVGLASGFLAAAAAGTQTSFAAPAGAAARASTSDNTYSCRVRRQHFVLFNGSVTLPPLDNRAQPGVLDLTTVNKTVKQQNGGVATLVQIGLSALRNSLRIDKSSCRPVTRQIPLKPKGLSGPPETVTPTFEGHLNQRCGTRKADRVLVRLHVVSKAGAPTQAQLAIRTDTARPRPIAFYTWAAHKLSAWTASGCVDLS